jgi:hypothetical protein
MLYVVYHRLSPSVGELGLVKSEASTGRNDIVAGLKYMVAAEMIALAVLIGRGSHHGQSASNRDE